MFQSVLLDGKWLVMMFKALISDEPYGSRASAIFILVCLAAMLFAINYIIGYTISYDMLIAYYGPVSAFYNVVISFITLPIFSYMFYKSSLFMHSPFGEYILYRSELGRIVSLLLWVAFCFGCFYDPCVYFGIKALLFVIAAVVYKHLLDISHKRRTVEYSASPEYLLRTYGPINLKNISHLTWQNQEVIQEALIRDPWGAIQMIPYYDRHVWIEQAVLLNGHCFQFASKEIRQNRQPNSHMMVISGLPWSLEYCSKEYFGHDKAIARACVERMGGDVKNDIYHNAFKVFDGELLAQLIIARMAQDVSFKRFVRDLGWLIWPEAIVKQLPLSAMMTHADIAHYQCKLEGVDQLIIQHISHYCSCNDFGLFREAMMIIEPSSQKPHHEDTLDAGINHLQVPQWACN